MENLHSVAVMSKWRKWVIALGCAVAAIVLTVQLTDDNEPSYQGKPLSFWVVGLCPMQPTSPGQRGAEEAIRQIGTNATPYLLEWIGHELPARPIPNAVGSALNQMSSSLRTRVPDAIETWTSLDRDSIRAEGVPEAFMILGTNASAAIPDLERMLQDPSRTNTCRRAMYSLAAIQTHVPAVVFTRLADADPQQRIWALCALERSPAQGTNIESTLPLLFNCMQDSNFPVCFVAGVILSKVQVPPELIRPTLSNMLNSPASFARITATNTLRRLDNKAVKNSPPQ